MIDQPTTTALVPWFGCARMIAERVGQLIGKQRWVGVPFAGGMPELLYIDAPTIAVNDLHWQVVNLARVCADPVLGPRLYRRLRRLLFHPAVLREAQERCQAYRWNSPVPLLPQAEDYFVACWMGRSGKSGIDGEFNGRLSVRWNGNGGDSNTRYRSAVKSLIAWRRILQRCNFTTLDAFAFLAKVQDEPGHALYCDPPFFGPGDRYRYKFTESQHRQLAEVLSGYTNVRVVVRYYDVPLVRELYPVERWQWNEIVGRKQSNAVAAEVLLTNEKRGRLFD